MGNATEEITDRIERYMLHDPIGNMEGEIAEFDKAKLLQAETQGAVFIAVHASGKREVVKAEDIVEPKPMACGVTVASEKTVLDIAKATCDVFDALAGEQPAVLALEADDAQGGQRTFAQALAALKALVYGEAADAEA